MNLGIVLTTMMMMMMMMMMMRGVAGHFIPSESGEAIKWGRGPSPLPVALSDMTATLLPQQKESENSLLDFDAILIVGGCNSETGNSYVNTTYEGYSCQSNSNKAFAYDPIKSTYTSLPDMPRQRYRHAAVVIAGNLWLVGGRTAPDDAIIPEVDVYLSAENKWVTPMSLPALYEVSDAGAFTDDAGERLFVVGGYSANYTALDRLFAVNAAEILRDSALLSITDLAPLATARGDIHAVTTPAKDAAFVTGGFTHANGFCAPHSSVERYDIGADRWSAVDSLKVGRGDKALVQLNGRIFAIGGETKPHEQCALTQSDAPIPLEEQYVILDDVEVLDPSAEGTPRWSTLGIDDDIPSDRFRFAAEAYDATNTIYAFGGQKGYDVDCDCFETATGVILYEDVPPAPHSHEEEGTSGAFERTKVTTTAALAVVLALLGGAVL